MKLIGMLDSPYVRRVAICLKLLGLPFEHQALSVFRDFDAFRKINPVVKAPTLVLDDGQVLVDSTLIIDYLSMLDTPSRFEWLPADMPGRVRALRRIGLALAACEKSVQIVYERQLRALEKQDAGWLERVSSQLRAAYAMLDADLAAAPLSDDMRVAGLAGISIAVAWRFSCAVVPDDVDESAHPHLHAYSVAAEQQAVFIDTPLF